MHPNATIQTKRNYFGENFDDSYTSIQSNDNIISNNTTPIASNATITSNSSTISSLSSNQRTINNFIDRISSIEQIENEKSFAKLIFQCGLPLSLSEMDPLKNWVKKTRPALKLPSRKKISTTLLDEVYQDTKKDVDKFINDAKFICLICGGW